MNAAGRLDLLLLRLGEMGTRALERKLGLGVSLWDGPGGVGEVAQGMIADAGLQGRVFTPRDVAAGAARFVRGRALPARRRRAIARVVA